jgi:uncharacterized peroxidase-related enzyme
MLKYESDFCHPQDIQLQFLIHKGSIVSSKGIPVIFPTVYKLHLCLIKSLERLFNKNKKNMSTLKPLTREQANSSVQPIFDVLKSKVGMVPNLYATIANSPTTLPAYLAFDEALGKGVYNAKERQAIFLVVSQVNGCHYCQSAHTALGKMNGFTEEETIQLRTASIADKKLKALTTLAADITRSHGKPSDKSIEAFYEAGYTNEALVELVAHIGYKTVANYLHNIAHFPIDFPVAKELETVSA